MRIGLLVAGYAVIAFFALNPWLEVYRRRDELRRTDRMDKAKREAFKWTVGVAVFVGVAFWLMSVAAGDTDRCPEGQYWDSDGGGYGMSGAIGACV